MAFHPEPEAYRYSGWADLQGAWEHLRELAIQAGPFPERDRFFLHLTEGMSWDSVRELTRMQRALLLVRNLARQGELPRDLQEAIEGVGEALNEIHDALARGDAP